MKAAQTYSLSYWFWMLPALMTLVTLYSLAQPYSLGTKVIVSLLCLLSWFGALTIPVRIDFDGHTWIVLKSLVTTIQINVNDIVAIERNGRTVTLRHRHGKVDLGVYYGDLESMLAALKALNPTIVDRPGALAKLIRIEPVILVFVIGLIVLGIVVLALTFVLPSP